MEQRLPFIAAVISGIATWIATALFLTQYLALTTIALIIAILIFRFNPWAFFGAFLTGLAIELFKNESNEQFRIVLLILLVGSGLQLAAVLLPAFFSGLRLPSSSVGQNMVFGVMGIILCYGLQFWMCKPSISVGSSFNELVSQVNLCQSRLTVSPLNTLLFGTGSRPEILNAVLSACMVQILLSPLVWAGFFAAARQVNFNLLQLKSLLAHTLTAALGSLVFLIVLAILLVPVAIVFGFVLNRESTWPESVGATISTVIVLGIAWAAGRGAHWE